MAELTGIEWCDATFNPWIGCEKVSPGCAHCYAETLVHGRMGRGGTWGADGTRQVTSDSNWKKPLRWARLARDGKLPDGTPNLDGHRPRVFCASLADVFEDRPELDEARERLFLLIEATLELDWLLLTKRPDFMAEWLDNMDPPWPNAWLGVSIENARHTWRADVLREIPATIRFLSCEPLLGSLYPKGPTNADLDRQDRVGDVLVPGARAADLLEESEASPVRMVDPGRGEREPGDHHVAARRLDLDPALRGRQHRAPLDLTGIDWVIIGGESGAGARPMRLDWAREIVRACLALGVEAPMWPVDPRPAVFVKQLGAKPIETLHIVDGDKYVMASEYELQLKSRKGGDWDEWPADLRIREFPERQAVPA